MPAPEPPFQQVGWTAKAVSPEDWQTTLAEIVRYADLGFVEQISDLGSGIISIDANDPVWNDGNGKSILNQEVLWRIFQDGVVRSEFLSEDIQEDIVPNGDETDLLKTFIGRGTGAILDWATVMPEGYGGNPGGSFESDGGGLLPLMRGSGPDESGNAPIIGGVTPPTGGSSFLEGTISGYGTESYGTESTVGQRVLEFAAAQIGKPYVFGTWGLSTYDCSGLTKRAWYEVTGHKVNLVHHARTQFQTVKHVPGGFAAAIAGDLVFFDFGNQCPPYCPGHVAICTGDGVHIVSATNTTVDVEYRAIGTWIDNVMAIGRPLYQPPPPPPPGGGGGSGGSGSEIVTGNHGLLSLMRGGTSAGDSLGGGARTFTGPFIATFIILLNEAIARGTIPFINLNFDETVDSVGKPWDDSQTIQVDVGTSLLQLWTDICKQNAFEWHMDPGFLLSVYKTTDSGGGGGEIESSSARGLLGALRGFSHRQHFYEDAGEFGHHTIDSGLGTHKEDTVRFEIGLHQTSHDRSRTRRGIRNFLFVRMEDGVIFWNQDERSEEYWGRREGMLDKGKIAVGDSTQDFIDTTIASTAEEQDSRTVSIVPDAPGRSIFLDYGLGDFVAVDTGSDRGHEVLRLVALALKVNADTEVDLEVTLTDVISSWEEKVNAAIGAESVKQIPVDRLVYSEEDLSSMFESVPLHYWSAGRIVTVDVSFRAPPSTGAATVEILVNSAVKASVSIPRGSDRGQIAPNINFSQGDNIGIRTGGPMSAGAEGMSVVFGVDS